MVEVETEDEVLLATFNERLGDIERLVSEGARVTLRVPDGQPILDDPTIVMVANAAPVAEEGDDDSLEETVMTHKLVTDFDFVEANSVNKQTDKKLAEAEKKRRGNPASQGNDDDFDDFNYDPRD